ncbi:MAG: YkvA family protein [Candidatus Methanodesulfokora sp.]
MSFLKKYAQKVRRQMYDIKWDILALYLARKDPRIPLRSKIFVAIAVAYFLTPVDLIPDFIPVVGQLEDLIIVPALLGLAVRSIPQEVLDEYKKKARVEFEEGSPIRSLEPGLIMVISLWIIIIALIIYLIIRHLYF